MSQPSRAPSPRRPRKPGFVGDVFAAIGVAAILIAGVFTLMIGFVLIAIMRSGTLNGRDVTDAEVIGALVVFSGMVVSVVSFATWGLIRLRTRPRLAVNPAPPPTPEPSATSARQRPLRAPGH